MHVHKIHTATGHRASLYTLARGLEAGHVLSAGGDGWLTDWSLNDPENGRVLAVVESRVFSLATFPEAGRLVAGNMDGGLHWISPGDPAAGRNIQHHQKGVFDLQVHADWLFSAGGEGTLTRWHWPEARSVESFQLSNRSLRSVAVSPLRGELAVGGSDGAIRLLDLHSLALKRSLPQAHDPAVFTLAYSPNQRYLFSGGRDAQLRVWDAEQNFALVSEQAAHLFTINHLVFSPDGSLLATASRDKTIKIWDAATVSLLKVIDTVRHGGHINSVNRLLWLPEGLLSCSDDRSVMWWAIQP